MKILQINTVCGTGSTGRIVTDISEILQKENNECLVIYGIGYNSNNGVSSIKMNTKLEVKIHSMLSQLFDSQGRGSYFATKRIIKKIKEYNPDIIHLHNLHGCYLNIRILFNYIKKSNTPIVWTLHDCWPITGHCAHFDYVNCIKWKDECKNCIQKKEYPKNIFINRTKKNYNFKKKTLNGCKNLTIVTPSQWLSNLIKQSYLNKYNVKVINNGIDLNIFKPTKSNIREEYKLKDKFVILGVANVWSNKKGLKHFIELSKKLKDDEVIVLVGITEEQKKQIPQKIITFSKTNDVKELAKLYSMADVFVNPTLEDTFPTTNLEALACGVPVITFNTGGSPESIDKRCGRIVERGNLEELYNEIINLKNMRFKKEDCIEKSKNYDKNNKYEEYIQLYKNIINGDK